MDLEIENLRKDINSLSENLREIQNSNTIDKCLKNIQIRLISKLISRAREKIDFLEDMKKCNKKLCELK